MLGLLSSPLQSQPQQDGIAQQLARLAIEQRFNAIVLEHVAQDQIAHCPYPMLIHVMSGRYSTKPDYYTLCMGVSGGDVNLFSPSLGDFSVPLNQLESDRRGEAIVLSRGPLPADAKFLHHSLPIAQYTIMLAVVLTLAALAVARRGEQGVSHFPSTLLRMRGSCVQLLRLAIVAFVLTVVCRFVAGGPFCPAAPAPAGQPIDFLLPPSSATAAALIKPPEISVEAALRLVRTDALFVDARDANEYHAGHIRSAILCPAADIDHWRLHMAGIDPHARIIVYCAQASCGKGAYVASFLLKNGFTNVVLYRDGWAKWTGPREAR
jgi:rhodanese-related sulfurtransferase